MTQCQYDINFSDESELYKIASCYDHLSGFIGWKDLSLSYLFVSNKTAKLVGFDSSADFVGASLSDADLRCPAAEVADQFAFQDKQVIRYQKPVRVIDFICYANNDWRVLLGEKFPIIDSHGAIKAVGLSSTDITHSNLAILNFEMLAPYQKNKKKYQQFSYTIGPSHDAEFPVSDRQLECIFYLLRGATGKTIAERLNISTRTAETHINMIKEKFNCASKQELVEKLICRGYLNLIPESCVF